MGAKCGQPAAFTGAGARVGGTGGSGDWSGAGAGGVEGGLLDGFGEEVAHAASVAAGSATRWRTASVEPR